MANSIIGTLPINQSVDSNGSLTIDVGLHLSPAKTMPEISFAYHSAASGLSPVGLGWVMKGAPIIERVPATLVQDGFRGAVRYDKNDRFALDGQRLVQVRKNEYRFEIEQWSKIIAKGSDPANPDSWEQHLPDGTTRLFGATTDSNIKALGQVVTRVWAVSEIHDAFSNYTSFIYDNDTTNGAFYLSQISSGGNRDLAMKHQRQVDFAYEDRPDKRTSYLGGYKIYATKRLATIASNVQSKLIHTYHLQYDLSPLSAISRLRSLTLSDPSGASVRPLKFDWIDGHPSVFEPTKAIATIPTGSRDSFVIPLDVAATGRSDLVIASKRLDKGAYALDLAIYKADGKGGVSSSSAPGSGPTGLHYPFRLFPMEVNGDGKIDLLHIWKSDTDKTYTLTVLLSTAEGYKPQTSQTFKPESMSGDFHAGDFEGDGRVGLVYVYDTMVGKTRSLKFVQFTSDGSNFKASDPRSGPSNQTLNHTDVIVGDFDGNGVQDVFLACRTFLNGTSYYKIELIESVKGTLTYRTDDPFASSSGKVLWTKSSTVLPFAADTGSKTSLLFIWKTAKGKLQMQVMRNTGVTLLPDSQPTDTDANYNRNVTISRSTSTNVVNLLNVSNTTNGIKVDVFIFDSERFAYINSTQQPQGVSRGTTVNWADLRGIGRADCLMSTMDTSGTLAIRSMPCYSTNSQPIDFISGYENGLGATVAALYAPLSDSSIYNGSGEGTTSTTAAINAMARNAASSDQEVASTRSEIVHFPFYVVKQLSVSPSSTHQDVREIQKLTYTNARLEFSGRGWLGFESISRTYQPIGVTEATSYFQKFPFLGQTSKTETHEVSGNKKVLQVNEYPWKSVELNSGKNVCIRLPSLREKYYEAGVHSHDVDVSLEYDDYANATKIVIICSKNVTSPLLIQSKFDNDLKLWAIGRKTSEVISQNITVLKKTEYTYVPGTHIPKSTRRWVSDSLLSSKWSSQSIQFDKAGNQISVDGPSSSQVKFEYDETYSYVSSASTFTDASHAIRETTTYDLANGKPLSITDANGFITQRKYDVLGRLVEVSEGAKGSISVSEKRSYHFENNEFFEKRLRSTGLGNDTWTTATSYFDGFKRVWRTEKSRPDDLSKSIYSFSKYDGAGRLVESSRDYFDPKASPPSTTYGYDTRSRVVREVSPPVKDGASSITTTCRYTVDEVVETRSEGQNSKDQVTVRKISHLPNPEPSAGHFVKPFITNICNPLEQCMETKFDGLGRPIQVKDPSGVQLSLTYDGLSRQIKRQLQNAELVAKIFSLFTVQFDDNLRQTTVRNELTNSTVVSNTDFASRVITRTTKDETISFVYDDDAGTYTKGRLFKASSSKGYTQQFDYDIRGHTSKSKLHIDGHDYVTSLEWTSAGQLRRTTNPDSTIVTHNLLPDGRTVGEIVLTDGHAQASAILSQYDNPFQRPLSCKFGNGLVSKSTITENGMLTKNTLESGSGTPLFEQSWTILDSGLIGGYRIDEVDSTPKKTLRDNTFQYDLDGQLISDNTHLTSPSFSYEKNGNLSQKYGQTFVSEGWQLTTVKNSDGSIQSSFDYSVDGNLTKEKDGTGSLKRTMKYDSQNRLIEIDGTTFTYDFGDRLIKAVSPSGEITIYPSKTYEVRRISASSKTYHTAYIDHGYRRASLTTEIASQEKVGDAKIFYFHNDQLGSTIAASDSSGNIIAKYQYDSFGKVTVQGDDVARYKFQGKELFGSVYYFGARFYDPTLGRFLTLDNFPITLANITPSTFNMYSFARNDPINFIDFNGNTPWWHWLVDIGLTLAGVVCVLIPIPGVQVLGAGFLGAGISGLITDITNPNASNESWAIDLGIGAAFGLVSGGLGVGVDALIASGNVAKLLAARGASDIFKLVARMSVRVTTNALIGGVTNMGAQMVANWRDGERWDHDLAPAFVMGVNLGFLTSAFAEGVGLVWAARIHRPGTQLKMKPFTKEFTSLTTISSRIEAPIPRTSLSGPHPASARNPLPGVHERPNAGNPRRQIYVVDKTSL